MKKPIALLMAAALVVSTAACGNEDNQQSSGNSSGTQNTTPSSPSDTGNTGDTSNTGSTSTDPSTGSNAGGTTPAPSIEVEKFEGNYTFKEAVSVLCSNWNPHTYQTTDDGYLAEYIRSGFYDFVFNDELHVVEGKDPFTSYKIIPVMAASEPVDVTEAVKKSHPQFNIPESATSGYAYTIDLNPDAVWEDGTPINADSYVYSMQQLLNPDYLNYRAADYTDGDFVIAGAEGYLNSGKTIQKENSSDGEKMTYTIADLVKGSDGAYTTPEGYPAFFGLNTGYAWNGGKPLSNYTDLIPADVWSALSAVADEEGYVPVTDESMETLYKFTGSADWGNETKENLGYYVSYTLSYPTVDFSSVGLFKSGDYQITIVFAKALSGFNLLYSLTSNWLVKEDIYESCKKMDGTAYSTTYNTSVETTSSYGPYKLVEYQADKALKLVRNDNWVGYSDGQHIYKDPTDGKYYPMYMSNAIECQVVEEASTRKMMFLKGELMSYGLQSEDFATYKNSEYAYKTPLGTIYFFIFNGYLDAIQNREAAANFDKTKYDLETMTLKSFRQAIAVTYDKELMASTISPSRSGGYGLIGATYLYDPANGLRYRDTDQAKQALCDFYSVDVSKYSSLDEAVNSITGYDPVAAKELYKKAYDESLAAGYITDSNNDGICDQDIEIEYSVSLHNTFVEQTVNYLNEKLAEVLVGTPFEGKVRIKESAPYGNEWSTKLREGLSDLGFAGWNGSVLNPFSLTDLYTNPSKQYDGKWFDASAVKLELEIAGEKITMNLKQWSDALNGTTVTVGGKEYNFGENTTDVNDRLTILAAIESEVLQTYNYIPMMQNASLALLSQQVYYVVEEYNPVMSRGGVPYLKYNYTDEEWAAYVTSQGGELRY